VTIQAQYNEALIVMFSGYHPDHFWREEAEEIRFASSQSVPSSPGSSSSSSPGEKKFDSVSSNSDLPEKDKNEDAGAATTQQQNGSKLEEHIQRLMTKLEEQSRQLEKQSLELDSLRALVSNQKKER